MVSYRRRGGEPVGCIRLHRQGIRLAADKTIEHLADDRCAIESGPAISGSPQKSLDIRNRSDQKTIVRRDRFVCAPGAKQSDIVQVGEQPQRR